MGIRKLAASFVAAPPSGTSTEARLWVTHEEDAVLWELYRYGGKLKAADLACLVGLKALDGGAVHKAQKNPLTAARKRNLTDDWSARVASTIYRKNDHEWELGLRNLEAHKESLSDRIGIIEGRLSVNVGNKSDGVTGYKTEKLADAKTTRLRTLQSQLVGVDSQLEANRPSICIGGKALARKRHNLEAAKLSLDQWQHQWDAARGWLAANGTRGEIWGNDTISVSPYGGVVEIMLPPHLEHMTNSPGRRRTFVLSHPVKFNHLSVERQEKAHNRLPIRYELAYKHPIRNKQGGWYLAASWSTPEEFLPSLASLREQRTLAVDLNGDHLACYVIDQQGNPVGEPITLSLPNLGSSSHNDAQVRHCVTTLLKLAFKHGCASITIENLGFARFRRKGKESYGGKRGKKFRRTVMGMPTAAFRDRLISMASNLDVPIYIIAVDPAYTSVLGKSHWLDLLKSSYGNNCSSHHAAAVVIGRRGKGLTARRHKGVHASERKSYRDCFSRDSIRDCDLATHGKRNRPYLTQKKDGAFKVVRHVAKTSEKVAGSSGGDKPFTSAEPSHCPNGQTPIQH